MQVIRTPRAPRRATCCLPQQEIARIWVSGSTGRDFDLWVVYYGDHPDRYAEHADFYGRGKGTKFQNLHRVYQRYGDAIAQYDAVMVSDDDILIDATGLTRLFEIRKQLNLWVVQPAFRLAGKISWDITRMSPTSQIRYTNFIEMTCPLFRRDKLDLFMANFDPQLSGYGEDWWFLNLLGPNLDHRLAIVDEVSCVNPFDNTKGGEREIDRVNSHMERKEVWERLKLAHGLNEQGREHLEYGRIPNSFWETAKALTQYVPDWTLFKAKQVARSLLR